MPRSITGHDTNPQLERLPTNTSDIEAVEFTFSESLCCIRWNAARPRNSHPSVIFKRFEASWVRKPVFKPRVIATFKGSSQRSWPVLQSVCSEALSLIKLSQSDIDAQ